MPNSFKFSKEVRLGELLSAFTLLCMGIIAYGNFTSEMALIKQAQASQGVAIAEVKTDVKETRASVRELEIRVGK